MLQEFVGKAVHQHANSPIAAQGPEWPAYTRDEEKHIVLDTPISTGAKLHGKTLDALEKLNAK